MNGNAGEPLQFGNVYFNGDPTQLQSLIGRKMRKVSVTALIFRHSTLPDFLSTAFRLGDVPAFANNFTSSSANTLRNFPFTLDNLRNQRFLKFDVGISKNFRIRENMKFQIRVEAINLLNTPYFSARRILIRQTLSFGLTIAPTRQPPRDIQIGGRFTF